MPQITRPPPFRQPITWLVLILCSTFGLYWIGLDGTYLFDDGPQLIPVSRWLQGQLPLQDMLLNNSGWATHRALAFATLAVNAAIGGFSPFSFKLGNLLVHLICGMVIYLLLARLLQRDSQLATRAQWFALGVAGVWLLHPFHVSTVLYPIQRMAQVATLVPLLGLLGYASVRQRMIDGRLNTQFGMALLWIGLPLVTFLAIQGKQSGAMFPALCLVVELAWFQNWRQWRSSMRILYIATVALPALLVVAVPVLFHDRLQMAFSDYNFGPSERLLSQPRVLWDYIRMLLVPYTPAMGLFGDGFAPSRGFWQPWTTLPALLGLVTISLIAWKVRKHSPAIFAGWFIFLVGHSVEASYVPIELYYEHRNYLPAVGLLLAVAAALDHLVGRAANAGLRMGRIMAIALGGIVLVLSVQLAGRALVFTQPMAIVFQGAKSNPKSLRAILAYSEMLADNGKVGEAFASWDQFSADGDRGRQVQSMLARITLQCQHLGDANPEDFRRALALTDGGLPLETYFLVNRIMLARQHNGCGKLTAQSMAEILRETIDTSVKQPDTADVKYSLRYLTSGLYLEAGMPEAALAEARLAWQPGAPVEIGQRFVEVLLESGRWDEAEQALAGVARRAGVDLQAPAQPGRDVWDIWKLQRYIEDHHPAGHEPDGRDGGD